MWKFSQVKIPSELDQTMREGQPNGSYFPKTPGNFAGGVEMFILSPFLDGSFYIAQPASRQPSPAPINLKFAF